MYTKQEIENKLIALKPMLIEKFYVSTIGYFGSYAKNEQSEASDLDILVEFSQPIGWEFCSLQILLKNHFGLDIDLVTKNGLKERIKDSILKQVQYI